MSDKIGVLGEATTVSIATTTVYTVPTGKAAKVQLMFLAKSGADSSGTLAINVNGIAVATSVALTTVEFFHSSNALLFNDPSATVTPGGLTAALTVAPAPMIYYLSAGDIVSYTVAVTALNAMNIQVVGTEIDV